MALENHRGDAPKLHAHLRNAERSPGRNAGSMARFRADQEDSFGLPGAKSDRAWRQTVAAGDHQPDRGAARESWTNARQRDRGGGTIGPLERPRNPRARCAGCAVAVLAHGTAAAVLRRGW